MHNKDAFSIWVGTVLLISLFSQFIKLWN